MLSPICRTEISYARSDGPTPTLCKARVLVVGYVYTAPWHKAKKGMAAVALLLSRSGLTQAFWAVIALYRSLVGETVSSVKVGGGAEGLEG